MEGKKTVLSVNIYDEPIKEVDKILAHEKAILHRAFSVFLFNENKMLIQKRAKTKYHSPLLWANACCSHPLDNNILKQANARLKEELGIVKEINLTELYSFIYFAKVENLFEYELDHVLIGNYNGKIKINKNEAEKILWIDIKKLEKQLIKNPQKFAPWFLICTPKVLNYYEHVNKKIAK